MRKFFLLSIFIILLGCTKDPNTTSERYAGKGEYKISASMGATANTKVTISDLSVKWNSKDTLYLFQIDNSGNFLSTKLSLPIDSESISSDGLSADFYGDKPTEGASYIATSCSNVKICDTDNTKLEINDLLSNLYISDIEDNWAMLSSSFVVGEDEYETNLNFDCYQSQVTFNLRMADDVDEDIAISSLTISTVSAYVTSTLLIDNEGVVYTPDTTYYNILIRYAEGITLTNDSYFSYCESFPLIQNFDEVSSGTISYEITTSDGRTSSVSLPADILQQNSIHEYDLVFPEPTYGSTYSGKVTQLKTATKGANTNGVNFIIMGDGFTENDMADGGAYSQRMTSAVTAITDIEPYTTYSDYINIYCVDVVSESSGFNGVTMALGSTFGEGTEISGDNETIVGYASLVSGIDLTEAVIIVVVNSYKYAGTCYFLGSGATIAFVPYTYNSYENFSKILHHEALGHGFGKFLDEYTTYEGYITDEYISSFNQARNQYNLGYNLSIDENDLPWEHLLSLENYSEIGVYEGGFFFTQGVWRSEYNSCMNDNTSYFSAICRELIVKRIMSLSGEEYDFDDFINKDVRSTTTTKSTYSLDEVYEDFVPLHPPVLLK